MRSSARIVAVADLRGTTRFTELRGAAPLALRVTRDALYLVSTAQSLLGDDEVDLEILVGKGATLRVRSAAAMIAYASKGARFSITAEVEESGLLDWRPEPIIATGRCETSIDAKISLQAGAALSWHEECLLGRFGEQPGELELGLFIDHDDAPLLRQQLRVGPRAQGWNGPAVLGCERALGYRVLAGSWPRPRAAVGEGWGVLELDGPGTVISALASDLPELRRRIAAASESGLGSSLCAGLGLVWQ